MKNVRKVIVLLATIMLIVLGVAFCVNAENSHELCDKVELGVNDFKAKELQVLCFTPEEDDLYNFSIDCYGGKFDVEDEDDFYLDYNVDIFDSKNVCLDYEYIEGKAYHKLKKDQTYHVEIYMDWDFGTPYCNLVIESYQHVLEKEEEEERELLEKYTPESVNNLVVSSVSESSITLIWDKINYVDGYVIYSYNADMKTRKEVKRIVGADTTEATISELKSDSKYIFAIESFDDVGLGPKYSDASEFIVAYTNPDMSSINTKISKGYFADILHNDVKISCEAYTNFRNNYYSHGHLGDISHFFDYKGYYTVVSQTDAYIYVDKYDSKYKNTSTLKIKKKYPLFGDMITDKNGNYYIVWGKEDHTMNGGIVTMAVSKYSYSGKYIATATYKTKGGISSWDTKIPFGAGNCVTIIDSRGVLICNYARGMYNGHQSNDILCVDTETMKTVEKYNNYVSHSFDQRVFELGDGDICFINKGDAYPRAFDVEIFGSEHKRYQPFHFYGELGHNQVYAWLGGAVEVSGNIYLVASSAKSMTSACKKENYNLFVQLVDDNRTIKCSVNRKGTSCDEKYEDKGIKWLTDYSSEYTVVNPQVVKIDNERFVILWEKIKYEDASFVQSYYMILSADGLVLQDATPIYKTRLTAQEEPIYRDGYIYWTTGSGSECVIHKLKVSSVVNKLPTPKVTSVKNVSDGVTVTWEPVIGTDKYRVLRKTPDGEWKKVKDTTATTFTDKTVENSKEYLYTVKCVSSNGKKNLSDYDKTGVKIYHLKPTTLKAQAKQKTVSLTWSKISKSTGYEIEYSTDKNFKKNNKTVTLKGASKISQSIKNLSAGKTYYFRVRSYKKLSGKTYYATWSKTTKIKISG